jgi:hypothetical protein
MIDKAELARETRKRRRLEQLGSDEPRCGICGDTRWQCIELHHTAGKDAVPDHTVLTCRNCHRMLSDDQRDPPTYDPERDGPWQAIGHFLLGLADMLRLIIDKLREYGLLLIDRAAHEGSAAR